MTAIAEPLPLEVDDFRQRALEFAEREVLPRHEQHRALLDDPRERYDAGGRLQPAVVDLIREVRAASAREGIFTACVPEKLGGSGQGHLAYYAGWQTLFHRLGPRPPSFSGTQAVKIPSRADAARTSLMRSTTAGWSRPPAS